MNILHFIQLAGLAQLCIAAANLPLGRMLDYRGNLAKVSPIIRQIFTIHSIYIVGVLIGFAAISILFPHDLAGGSSLGRFFSGFLAMFWLSRVVIQFVYYDAGVKREHRFWNAVFTASFLYLGVVFACAVLHPI